jgi:hypothetical protein
MHNTYTELEILRIVQKTGASVWARTTDTTTMNGLVYYFEVQIEEILNNSEVRFTVLPSVKDEYSTDNRWYAIYPYTGRQFFIPPAGKILVFTINKGESNEGENCFRCEYKYDSILNSSNPMTKRTFTTMKTNSNEISNPFKSHTHFTLELNCSDTQIVCFLYKFFGKLNQQFETQLINIIAMFSFGYYGTPGGGFPANYENEKCCLCRKKQRLRTMEKLFVAIEDGSFVVASRYETLIADFDKFKMSLHIARIEEDHIRCSCHDNWGENNPLNKSNGYSAQDRKTQEKIWGIATTQLGQIMQQFMSG